MGAFFLVAENLRSVVETVRDESTVTVFLKSTSTEADRADLERLVKETRLVTKIRRVSPEDARARFSTWWKSLGPAARSLPGNPFPASIEMELEPAAVSSEALPPFLALLAAHRATEEVQFDVEWIRRLRGAVALARLRGSSSRSSSRSGRRSRSRTSCGSRSSSTGTRSRSCGSSARRSSSSAARSSSAGSCRGSSGPPSRSLVLWIVTRAVLAWVAATKNALLGVFAVRFLPAPTCLMLVAFGLAAGLLGGVLAVRRRNLTD